MQPQLTRIRRVLADLSMDYLNRHDSAGGGATGLEGVEEEELRVIQHMSAACRASHEKSLRTLPSAWLLRQVDDRDVAKCREGRLDYGSIIALLVVLPLSIMLLNETIGDVMIDSLIPSVFSGVLICGDAMLSVSIALLVVPLVVIIGVPLYIIFLYRPAKIAVFRRLEIRKAYWDKVDLIGPAVNSKRTEAINSSSNFSNLKGMITRLSTDTLRAVRVISMHLQGMVVQYSTSGREQRLNIKRSKLNIWQNMNKPPYAQVYICIYIYMCIYVYMYMCTYVLCMYANVYRCRYTYVYVHTYIHICTGIS
jgi:hypothetical protein